MPKRYGFDFGVHDDFAEFFDGFSRHPFVSTFSLKGRLIDENDYIITPKKHVVERQVKEKEQRLDELKKRKDNEQKWFDEQIKSLSLEIDQLKQKLSP